jgi:hypothetical protein
VADDLHPERVPGAEAAKAEDAKFTDYLLSETHVDGRGKAKFFNALGYSKANWADLRDQFLAQLPRVPCRSSREGYGRGQNYEAIIAVTSSTGTANVRTFWEVHPDEGTKLVTAYPLDSGGSTSTS